MSLRAGGLTGLMNQPSVQVIDGSLRFNRDSSTRLEKTFSSSGSASQFTWSYWVKRKKFGVNQRTFSSASGNGSPGFVMRFNANEKLEARNFDGSNWSVEFVTTRVFRDIGWYHIVCAIDVSQSATTDRVKLYVNGERITAFDTTNYTPGQGAALNFNGAALSALGSQPGGGDLLDGGMTNFYAIDGLALGPGYFGFTDPLTGTWRLKKFRAEGTTVNDGTVWSNFLTGARTDNNQKDKAFDGSLTTKAGTSGSGASAQLTFASPKPIHYSSGVRVYVYWGSANDVTMRLDGGTPITVPGNTWTYLDEGTGSFNTLTVNGVSNSAELSAIEVDGVIMRDSTTTNLDFGTNGFYLPMDGNSSIGDDKSGKGNNWTPVNFGSSVGLDKATGALPILNTVNGGNYATVGVRTDANAANLVLAVPLVGSANDLSNSVNSGTTTKTTTVSGATASTAESNIYGGSFVFDGSNDEITVGGVSTDLDFGTGDYTAEAWFRLTATGDEYIISMGTDHGGAAPHWGINIYSTNLIRAGRTNSSGDTNHYVTHPFITNKWYHVAISRSGGISRLFLDGNLLDEGSNTDDIDPTTDLKIGRYGPGAIYYNGYIQDVRIYKGVGKYTESFNPPSTSPDILPDTPSGVSGGSKLTKVTDGAVSFDGSGDYLSLASSSDLEMGTGDFTIEMYVYSTDSSTDTQDRRFFATEANATSSIQVGHINTTAGIVEYADQGNANIRVTGTTSILNKWAHVAVVRNSGTVSLYIDGKSEGTPATDSNSKTASTPTIGKYPGASGHFKGFLSNIRVLKGTALYTTDFTPPTRALTNVTNTKLLCCQSNTLAGTAAVVPGASGINDGTPWSEFVTISEGVTGTNYNDDASNAFDGDTSSIASLYSGNMVAPYSRTTVVFTPPSPITVSSGLRVYMGVDRGQNISVNGTQTNASVSAGWNDTGFTGTLTSLTLGPTNLGSSSNPAAFEVDGVILKNLVSPKGNTSATNFNPFNTDINTVRGQETGYATLNPLSTFTGTLSEGNLKFSTSGGWEPTSSTIGVNSGKWFWEYKFEGTNSEVGISAYPNNTGYTGNYAGSYGVGNLGDMYVNGTETPNPYSAFASGSTIGQELDLDNGTFRHYVNGVVQPYVTESLDTSLTWFASGSVYGSSHLTYNFGQKPFKFPPPAGFQPLNAANLRPETVIARPDHYVKTVLWTGNDVARSIVTGNAPDLVWIKDRSITKDPVLCDSVRGAGETLRPDDPAGNVTSIQRVSAFNSNGFSVGTDSGVNNNNDNFVGWTWKAGGSKNTFNIDDVGYASAAAAGLNGGTITPTGASVGTKQGFSILKYQGNGSAGANISHGLLEAPKLMIHKSLDQSRNWYTITTAIDGSADYLYLNSTAVANNSSVTAPTSNLMYFTSSVESNNNTENYIVYMWHDVPGLQKFGSYVGNNDADGTYVELGFRPAVIIIKTTSGGSWVIKDSARKPANPNDSQLYANTNADEDDPQGAMDFLSNGFKSRVVSQSVNAAETYIYAAWAEAPTFNLYGGQSNAR